ncbi:MAG: hypothetical protein M0042_07245 [Nitrospiraceae bacterium]|nr:hypothetical protein [Nitrospiraceae bacterium]
MKSVWGMIAVLTLLMSIGMPRFAYAVSPSPVPGEIEEKELKGVKVKGQSLCLFQSGTEDVRKAFIVNDVIPVYREGTSHDLTEVGKIKVLSYVGVDYLKGEVVEGEIRTGDIAKKGNAASLVVSAGDACR